MGYRSDVMVLIYPETYGNLQEQTQYDQLKTLMNTTFKEVAEEFGGNMLWIDDDRVLRFEILGVKWYGSYGDVQAFENMLRQFRGDIPGYCTEFIRLGEDDDDTEVTRTGENNQYYLGISRSISCNV